MDYACIEIRIARFMLETTSSLTTLSDCEKSITDLGDLRGYTNEY
jgi:hypothetical protein